MKWIFIFSLSLLFACSPFCYYEYRPPSEADEEINQKLCKHDEEMRKLAMSLEHAALPIIKW